MARSVSRATGSTGRRSLPVFKAGEFAPLPRVAAMDELLTEDTLWEPHAHPTHELLWNERGMSAAMIEARTWTISPSVGLWIPAGTLHTGHAPTGTWYRSAQFDTRGFASLAEHPVAVDITPLLKLLLDRLTGEDLPDESRGLTERMVRDVLTPTDRALVVRTPDHELLRPIAAVYLRRPGDPRTLAQWAAQAGVSERTITRTFRAETGMGFSEWVAAVRAQRALLLLGGGWEIEDVAETLGYSSVSAFGSAFRRTTGLTPGKARAHG